MSCRTSCAAMEMLCCRAPARREACTKDEDHTCRPARTGARGRELGSPSCSVASPGAPSHLAWPCRPASTSDFIPSQAAPPFPEMLPRITLRHAHPLVARGWRPEWRRRRGMLDGWPRSQLPLPRAPSRPCVHGASARGGDDAGKPRAGRCPDSPGSSSTLPFEPPEPGCTAVWWAACSHCPAPCTWRLGEVGGTRHRRGRGCLQTRDWGRARWNPLAPHQQSSGGKPPAARCMRPQAGQQRFLRAFAEVAVFGSRPGYWRRAPATSWALARSPCRHPPSSAAVAWR